MSRVGYRNDTIQRAFAALDDLEQSMGWNMRCAFPSESQRRGEDDRRISRRYAREARMSRAIQ